MSYIESKKNLDVIRQKYGCKGEIILRAAIQMIVEHGQYNYRDEDWYQIAVNGIDKRHDEAEAEGKLLFITRDFEKEILKCAKELAEIEAYDLLIYIQKEIYLGGGEAGEPDYQRALQIIRNCLCYVGDSYGWHREDVYETLCKFREMELTDEEIEYFGWSYLFDVEEDEE